MNNIFSHNKSLDLSVHNHPIGTAVACGRSQEGQWSVWTGKRWVHGCTVDARNKLQDNLRPIKFITPSPTNYTTSFVFFVDPP